MKSQFLLATVLCSILLSVNSYGRTWTSADGDREVQADFVQLRDGKVVLRLSNGKLAVVPLEKFSKADQEFVANENSVDAPDDSDDQEPKVEYGQGDTDVSAELGGPGFIGKGWTTAKPTPLGDAKAVRGGEIVTSFNSWPENIRAYGNGSRTFLNSIILDLCYEPLLALHPETLEPIPQLVSHWQIKNDNSLFRFRIDPRAYWSDGKPVTSDDVIATYRLISDDTLNDPHSRQLIVGGMNEPKKISKYIFEVRCDEPNWRNFLTFSAMIVLPAHQIMGLSGKDYSEQFARKLTANTGAYALPPENVAWNRSLTLTRRNDYWGDQLQRNQGLNNFNKIKLVIIRDRQAAIEMVLNGTLDHHAVYHSKTWLREIPAHEAVKKNLVIAQEIFTKTPGGTQGLTFNMRKPPLDDIRIRKALVHLFDRKRMLEEFSSDAYIPLNSYFPATDGENPKNTPLEFDPEKAIKLIKAAGYTERDEDGIFFKDGKRLKLNLVSSHAMQNELQLFQEDCREAGVFVDWERLDLLAHWKRMMSQDFGMIVTAWTGSLFPAPHITWHSESAKQGGMNVGGMNDKHVDEIIDRYGQEFDMRKRNALLRKLDRRLYQSHPCVLQWYADCERIVYANKFGKPKGGFSRYGNWRDTFTTWWVDPQKKTALEKAIKDGQSLDDEPDKIRYWISAEKQD